MSRFDFVHLFPDVRSTLPFFITGTHHDSVGYEITEALLAISDKDGNDTNEIQERQHVDDTEERPNYRSLYSIEPPPSVATMIPNPSFPIVCP